MALGDPADLAISEAALRRLRLAIERLVNAGGLPFEGYISEDYIESGLTDAMLMDFRATSLPVVSEAFEASGDEWSKAYDVMAALDGEGNVHWSATSLSPLDVEAYGSRVEAPEAGGHAARREHGVRLPYRRDGRLQHSGDNAGPMSS
jgi:hypothetical protein